MKVTIPFVGTPNRQRFAAAAILAASMVAAQELQQNYDTEDALAKWDIRGDVKLDGTQARSGKALAVAPGARATLKLRDRDGAGEVKFWVFDDGTAPEDPKSNRVTAHWGVMNAEGRIVAAGPFCARYLSGDQSYSVAEYNPAKRESPFSRISFLGVKREAKWREWTFRFDPDKGLSILVDGRDVNAQRQRYDWNKSQVAGFAGVTIVGDRPGDRAQTLWVDDLSVTIGGDMNIQPGGADSADRSAATAPAVARVEEPLAGPAAQLRPEVRNVHPRLLFGPEDLPTLRERYNHPGNQPYRAAFLSYLGASRNVPAQPGFLTDATDGQRQGLWRMPTVAYHYLMTGEEASLTAAVGHLKLLARLENWETTRERDSGMSSANVMIGAALTYDWICDKLEPDFRETFRQKLVEMAHRQYHGGHRMGNKDAVSYWQNDPQNNHRWHRNAGLALAILAGYGGPSEDWLLTKTAEELQFVVDWLPPDGTSHESPTYLLFGGTHLLLAVEAMDRCLGTRLGEAPFFRNVGPFYAQTTTPGRSTYFYYGDSAGQPGKGYVYFLSRLAARHRQTDVQAFLDAITQTQPDANIAWVPLLWRDPDLSGGNAAALPRRALFGDLGLVYVREGWAASHVGLMFKCGPLGGFKLNEFRNRNGFKYINVAHDDPDANSFVLYSGGALLAETDRYSQAKQSSNYNTVLVNGRGQSSAGRPDVSGWNQPASGSTDMTQGIRLTAYKAANGIVAAEGEAGGAYARQPAREGRAASPGLNGFRRAVVWVEGRYILILDDVRPREVADISWLIQAKKLDAENAAEGRYLLANDGASARLHLVADRPIESEIGVSTADHRKTPLKWQQLRAHARRTDAVRFAAALTPWGGEARVALTETDAGAWKITVLHADAEDQWTWTASGFPDVPYELVGRLADGQTFRVGAADQAPIE